MATFGTAQRLELVSQVFQPDGASQVNQIPCLVAPSGVNYFIFINRISINNTQFGAFNLRIKYKNVPFNANDTFTNYNFDLNLSGPGGINSTLRQDYNQNPDFVDNGNGPFAPMEYGDRLLFPDDMLYAIGTQAGQSFTVEYTRVFYGGKDITI